VNKESYDNKIVHVIVGTLFLLYGIVRIYSYHSTSSHHVGLESAIAYWHFVDVVWLFCAPLWILYGSESFRGVTYTAMNVKCSKTVNNLGTPEYSKLDQITRVTTTLCNPTSLPVADKARGPEHAGKVRVEDLTLYGLLRGKIDYDLFIMTSGAPQNPIRHSNNTVFNESKNSSSKVVTVSRHKVEIPESHKSKVDNTV